MDHRVLSNLVITVQLAIIKSSLELEWKEMEAWRQNTSESSFWECFLGANGQHSLAKLLFMCTRLS